jgi:hypothetical protein
MPNQISRRKIVGKKAQNKNKSILLIRKTRPTPLQEFVKGRRPTLVGVKKIMLKIEKLIVEAKNFREAVEAYKLTPNEMISKGKIPVFFSKGTSVFGCYHQSVLLHAALKELGISARITRQFVGGAPHSTVIFRLNGKMYEADPFYENQIHLVDDTRKKYIGEAIALKQFKFIKPGSYTYADYKKERKTGKLV